MLPYVFLFTLLSAAAAFGTTYLLLRKTPFAPYSLLLSLVSFHPFLIVAITLLGYRPPVPVRRVHVLTPIVVGICLTIAVTIRYRSEIAAALRNTWKSSALIYGLAMASMVPATPLLLGSTSLAYVDWANGELVLYSTLAHGFLGLLHDPNYVQFFEKNMELRYGAELYLAALSALTGKAPLLLVNVVSALHKAAAIVAFAALCEVVRRERNLSSTAVTAANIGFAFSTILSVNHVLPFLAAQTVTSSVIVIGLALFTSAIEARRIQAFLAIHVLFIVITYAEALSLLCGLGALVFLEAAYQHRRGIPVAVAIIFGAGLLANPLLVILRLRWLYQLRLAVAGYNVLGSPLDDLVAYLAAALGFRYPYLDWPPPPHAVLIAGIILGLAAIAYGLGVAALRLRTVTFLALPLLLILLHVDFGIGVQPVGGAYYKSYKVLAALDFYTFLALAFLFDDLSRRQSWRRVAGLPHVLLLAGGGALIAGNVYCSVVAATLIRAVPSVLTEADIRHALRPPGLRGGSVVILAENFAAGLWDLMANYYHVPRLLINRKQAEMVYHNLSVALIEPTALPDPAVARLTKQTETVFDGSVIVPQIWTYSPGPLPVNIRALLESLAPGLRLRERATLFATSAVRVVDGTLINTGNPGAALDGNPNQPPAIVGVAPAQGGGSEAVLSFTYGDSNGSADIFSARANITSGPTYECYLSYNRPANQVALVQDDGKSWDTMVVGSSKAVENSRCAIDGARSSTSASGNLFTLRLALRFKPVFAGRKTVFTMVADYEDTTIGWQAVGFWDVP